jgi:hypothetical protein
MQVTLEVPDDIALALASVGDLSRHALEALAIDGYRRKTLTQAQVGRLLGLARIEKGSLYCQACRPVRLLDRRIGSRS